MSTKQLDKCPDCGAQNPTTEHLLKEYRGLIKAGFHNMLGHNARVACNQVVDVLHQRGVFSYDTIFGITEVKKWNLSKW